ncbi:MAG: DNA polymerase Y family protein [Parvularculaceae bacterium]
MQPRSLSAEPRILALWFPHWETDRLKRMKPSHDWTRPLITYEKIRGALRLVSLDAQAVSLGLYSGQALSEARAIVPELIITPADRRGDAAAFRKLCFWLTRFSPWAAMHAIGEALIDITGCAHLFGGEAMMIADIRRMLQKFGYQVQAAIADTAGAAWALARYAEQVVCPRAGARSALQGAPVEGLRLPPELSERLKRLGLKRIGQLYDQPRAPLRARFGDELLHRLDQALGHAPEAISPLLPPPSYRADLRLPEPIFRQDDVLLCLERLAGQLETLLEEDGKGGREFQALLFRVDGAAAAFRIRTSYPAREPKHLLRLFRNKLEDARISEDAGFGFDCIRLSVFACEPMGAAQDDIFRADPGCNETFRLIDRLSNRLHPENIVRIKLRDSHIPERAARFEPRAYAGASPDKAAPPLKSLRPIKLLARPEPIEAIAEIPDGPPRRFVWRGVPYDVAKASGPERIEDEWWRKAAPEPPRDYYRIEDSQGRRCWIYRQGLYERGDCAPKWFIHGFFA